MNPTEKNQSDQLSLISCIEDIIDSIYDGPSSSYGIININGNDKIKIRSQKTGGHGCEYFSNSNFQYEEILANYQAIRLTDPDNELFILLKNILGAEFVTFLDERCNEICGQICKVIPLNNILNNIIKR